MSSFVKKIKYDIIEAMSARTKGKLIVIEGTDGSGKKTQFDLLHTRLIQAGKTVSTLSFPQYGKRSAGMVEAYLNGAYGQNPDAINPYAASLFYALDRFDATEKIMNWLEAGHIVLLDRYVTSNAGHQGGKIQDPAQRKKFLQWLHETEHELLGIPKPDLVVILHVPSRISQKLVGEKNARAYLKKGTHDIHEADLSHLTNAESSYHLLAQEFPQNHLLLDCMERDRLLTRQEVSNKIWHTINQQGNIL